MKGVRGKTSPLLIQAFRRLQIDPVPFLAWMERVQPKGWVRTIGEQSLPAVAEFAIIALRLHNESIDVEIRTKGGRMVSNGDVVSIIAESYSHLVTAAIYGKPLSALAETDLLTDPENVITHAVVLERPRRLMLVVRAPAIQLGGRHEHAKKR